MVTNIHGDYELLLLYTDVHPRQKVKLHTKFGMVFAEAEPGRTFGITVQSRSGRKMTRVRKDGKKANVRFKAKVNGEDLGCTLIVGGLMKRAYVKHDGAKIFRELVFAPSNEFGSSSTPVTPRTKKAQKIASRLAGIASIAANMFSTSGETVQSTKEGSEEYTDAAHLTGNDDAGDCDSKAQVAVQKLLSLGTSVGKKQRISVFGSALSPSGKDRVGDASGSSGTSAVAGPPSSSRSGQAGKPVVLAPPVVAERRSAPFGDLVIYFDDRQGLEMRGILEVSRNPASSAGGDAAANLLFNDPPRADVKTEMGSVKRERPDGGNTPGASRKGQRPRPMPAVIDLDDEEDSDEDQPSQSTSVVVDLYDDEGGSDEDQPSQSTSVVVDLDDDDDDDNDE
jgi:hypothetical protein